MMKDISENLWKGTSTGKLIKCNLEQLRQEIGHNNSILESQYDEYSTFILTESYVASIWQFISQHDLTLKDNTPTIPMLRHNDSCIIKDFCNNP